MEWTDDAIVLSVRPHGETAAVLETLTHLHGRHLGLVHGGASRKTRTMLEPGNSLRLHWRARLSEQLGSFRAEPIKLRAGSMFERRDALAGLNAFTAMASAVLPEREPHAGAYGGAEVLLDVMAEQGFSLWAPLYVRWEAGLLEELGFGLDLSRCAVTGTTSGLAYVSPRTGKAVSRDAGMPYANRLFVLPAFLRGFYRETPSFGEIAAGLDLTAHFLLARVFQPNEKDVPLPRLRLKEMAEQREH